MTDPSLYLDAEQATRIVREHIDASQTVEAVSRLHSGSFNLVCEWHLRGQRQPLIAKICPDPDNQALSDELFALNWYREHTRVPVPQPLAVATNLLDGKASCLIMRRLSGRDLTQCKLSPAAYESVQKQLAHIVAELHNHHRERYGNLFSDRQYDKWLERFQPAFETNCQMVLPLLNQRTRWVIAEVYSRLEQWLPETGRATLIHGDLWASNIIVDDFETDHPVLSGLIDVGVNFSNVEYELAYLMLFRTVNQTFMDTYTRLHPLKPGFERRRLIYDLSTAMHHVKRRGRHHLETCEYIARQLARYI